MANESPAVILYDENGNRVGVQDTPLISIPDTYRSTVFGEIRVANAYTLNDLINKYEIDPREYETATASSGTVIHLPNQSAIQLAVTGASGSSADLRTNTYFRYQAGKILVIKMTGYNSDAGQTNQTREWGYFDDENGMFFRLSGTTLSIVRRSFVSGGIVDSVVNQSSWNNDTMDGTGPSGVNLDITKGNIYEIHLAWLGVGIVRIFINGYIVHSFNNSNSLTTPSMTIAQLPLRAYVNNSGASSVGGFTYICSSIIAQGGQVPPYYSFAAANSVDVTTTNVERPILSIRPKSTYNGIVNRMEFFPLLLGASVDGGRATIRIYMDVATLTGASFSSVNAYSGMEFDVNATAFTGGELLFVEFLVNTIDYRVQDISSLFNEVGRKMRRNTFNTSGNTMTITAIKDFGGNTSARTSISWKEVR